MPIQNSSQPTIWLIGNRGMLGAEVEALLKKAQKPYMATDLEVDITDPAALQNFVAERPLTWIINCAAYTAVDRAEDEPERAFRINAEGPRNLAQMAKGKKAKLIHISTDYVFDGTKQGAYEETDTPNPAGVYGKSKLEGERQITETLSEHFIIRTAWLYGKNGPNFVATMLRLFKEKKEISVVADQWGSPTYAPDLATVLLALIDQDAAAFGIYHFTNEGRITWHQFASAIYEGARSAGLITEEVLIKPVATAQYPTRAKRPANSYLAKEKIVRQFGINLKPWQDSLNRYLTTQERGT